MTDWIWTAVEVWVMLSLIDRVVAPWLRRRWP